MLPRDVWYSFFNSPYPAHKACTAIDAYFENEALCPVEEGVVKEIKWFDAPRVRCDASPREPLILIDLGSDLVLKVLHVEPRVRIGERVYAGDPLGRIVVSGYLHPWSHPHAHFEIRKASDPYRARGALKLDLTPTLSRTPRPARLSTSYVVVEVGQHYAWLRPRSGTGFAGLALCGGWVDGGMPHYGYGALIGATGRPEGLVKVISSPASNVWLVEPLFRPRVAGVRVRGLASYLNQSLLKVIEPPSTLSGGDEVAIELVTSPGGKRA